MSCLVDTSAWSLLLRRREQGSSEHSVAARLRVEIESGSVIALTGVIYQELLQGFRRHGERNKLIALLEPFDFLEPTRRSHEAAAGLRDQCLTRGVTVTTIDALIAQLAIEHQLPLLTADEDFAHIAKHSSLRLLR